MERAASSPTMPAVKNVTTLAIIFALLIGVKHEVGMLAESYRRISAARN
jgi:hypothetical protein